MKSLRTHLWLTLCLLFPLSVGGQTVSAVDTAAMMRSDYITASVLVVSPANEVYSMFGHCALRLNCPSKKMDYCFTFETSTDTKGLVNFFRGKARGGFAAAPTASYVEYYRPTGRGITEHILNLTPAEKISLWRNVDKAIAKGFSYRYDYMHTQCTSMVVYLVLGALSAPVTYHQLPDQLEGSFRDQMLAESVPYPWSRFFWQTVMGPEGDSTQPLEQKITPRLMPAVWQQATVGGEQRTLTDGNGQQLIKANETPSSMLSCLTPSVACTLLIIIAIILTVGQLKQGWRCLPLAFDGILLAIHLLLAIVLTALILFSELEATQWNWYVLVFNPLPELAWLVRPALLTWVCRCLLAIIMLTWVLTPFIPQLDLPHALLMGSMAVRLSPRIKTRQ